MKLKDNLSCRGEFTIQAFKKDGSVETYTDKNLIMNTARSNMAELIGGYDIGVPINKLVLGNKGHVGTDILDYKKVGEDGIFVSSRTELFAQDPLYDDENEKESFSYEITFDVNGNTAVVEDNNATGKIEGTTESQVCQVKRTVEGRTCTFEVTIPDDAGNKPEEDEVVAYTEASLYAGGDIFSMKTFPARIKENTIMYIITWSIIF